MCPNKIKVTISIVLLVLLIHSTVVAQDSPPDSDPLPPIESTPTVEAEQSSEPTAEATPEPTAQIGRGNMFTFDELGFGERLLDLKNSSTTYSLNVPAHWALREGTAVHLELQPIVRLDGVAVRESTFGGIITVEFNGSIIKEVVIDSNARLTLDIPIPKELLESESSRNSYPLTISLDSDFQCGGTHSTHVLILEDSFFNLPYHLVEPSTDLRQLPYPIQQSTVFPNEGTFVIPDRTDAHTLEALYIAAAGFGRMTTRTSFALVKESELSEMQKSTTHLIFVGQLEDFALRETLFPRAEMTRLSLIEREDGIVKMAVSPWESSKVILLLTGQTDDALIKAVNAITYGTIRPSTAESDIAVVKEVIYEEQEIVEPIATEVTFADLGYELRTLYGPNVTEANYTFNMPAQRPFSLPENGKLTLHFNHSDLVDYENSGFTVELNGRPIGSSHFSKETTSLTALEIDIPAQLLRPGSNTLTILTNLTPLGDCSQFADESAWLNIFPESRLEVPFVLIEDEEDTPIYTISLFPKPFSNNKTLQTTTFVIPEESATTWFVGLQLAFDLGKRINGATLQLEVTFADAIDSEVLDSDHLIVIGQASEHALIQTINNTLPGPFVEGENRIESDRLPVEYRVPQEEPLGYLQLIPSPWLKDGTILLIGGDSEAGVQNAAQVLLSNRRELKGDLVVVDQYGLYATISPVDEEDGVAEAVSEEEGTVETAVVNIETETEITSTQLPDPLKLPDDRPEEVPPIIAEQSQSPLSRVSHLPRLPLMVMTLSVVVLGALGLVRVYWFYQTRSNGIK